MEAKKALRAAVKNASAAMPEEERRRSGEEFARLVAELPEFDAARTVALYHALPDEAPTAEMLRRWYGHKRLALPVVGENGSMIFREYLGESDLGTGAFGIPGPETGAVIGPEEIDLVIVPGVAFDAAGRRLGRGGGFYDRYLSRPAATCIYKVGLCRPSALVPEIPSEPHDVVMDRVITIEN